MNKISVTINILFLTISYSTTILSMTIDNLLQHKDIEPLIINKLYKEDIPDIRLVCKKWASRRSDGIHRNNWYYMPDSIEKEYDNIVKRKKAVHGIDKVFVLFKCITSNNINAIRWIQNQKCYHDTITFSKDHTINACKISASMATIHTNNYNLAELIIKPTITDPTQCWKTVYHTISVPEEIRQFLSIDDNRDFSFILYLIAIWLDKAHDLKTLYKKKIPTALGQGFLIYKGLENNARNCFKMLLKKQNTKDIIKKRQIMYFKSALETKNKYFPKKLLKKKLFSLNGTIVNFGKITILDHYYNDEKLKDRNEIINLLLSLGAKTWNELERERRH